MHPDTTIACIDVLFILGFLQNEEGSVKYHILVIGTSPILRIQSWTKSPSKLKLSITVKRVLKVCRGIIVVLLLVFGVYFGFKHWKAYLRERNYYTVVVDCGSTGTRVNVYEWKSRSLGNQELPVLVRSYPNNSTEILYSKGFCSYHCMQTEPGLHNFVGNASAVRASLEPLILWAEQWVPHERHGYTPIFVLATAGLRKLNNEDARLLLDDMEDVIKGHSFLYRRSWIRVLSGKEEAYYGWIALNYKMGRLGNSLTGPTLGLLDLGGSSLQFVVEVNGSRRNDAQLMRSNIGPIEHQVLAYSLPSFGLNEACDRTVAMLSQMQPGGEMTDKIRKVRHPCLGSNDVQNYTCNICQQLDRTNQTNIREEDEYTFLVGEPDWERCKEIARATAINLSHLDSTQLSARTDCQTNLYPLSASNVLNLRDGVHLTGSFHALSGFFAVNSMLNLDARANLTKIWEKGKQFCLKSWIEDTSLTSNQNYVGQYCFRVPYMTSLIEDALCLGNKEILFGPGDLSWTLGASLVEGQHLWLSYSDTNISSLKSMEANFSPIFVFIFLLCLSLIAYYTQVKLPMPNKKAISMGPSLPSYIHPKHRPN